MRARSGLHASRYSAQFHQRRTNSQFALPDVMIWRAIARLIAASEPGYGESQ